MYKSIKSCSIVLKFQLLLKIARLRLGAGCSNQENFVFWQDVATIFVTSEKVTKSYFMRTCVLDVFAPPPRSERGVG